MAAGSSGDGFPQQHRYENAKRDADNHTYGNDNHAKGFARTHVCAERQPQC